MRMSCIAWRCFLALGVALIVFLPATAFAGLLATATVSTSSTSAPYDYTISLHNSGTTNIGTLWFAWTDQPLNYDFLPSSPTVTGMPSGWIAPIQHNAGIPGDGYSIEYYNLTGSAIAPGANATFSFTSPDPPATIAGPAFVPGNQVTTSFIYGGFPQSDAGFKFNASVVPEPSTLLLAGVGIVLSLLTLWGRRGRGIAPV